MTPRNRQSWVLLSAACLASLVGSARTASAQAYVPAAAPHPMILVGAYLDYSNLLLTPPRAYDLLEPAPVSSPEARMIAYRAFESSLRARTGRIATLRGRSTPESREAKRRILTNVGQTIESLPGGVLVTYGSRIWEQVQDATKLEVDGYRLRLQVDDAVQGKLAIKVQKRLR
jgi:hypothetical protein